MDSRTTIVPGYGRMAVKRRSQSDEKRGSLYLPPTNRDEGIVAEVVAVCEPYDIEGKSYKANFSIGDVVMFSKFVGSDVTVGSEEFIVLREADVLCTLKEVPDGTGPT